MHTEAEYARLAEALAEAEARMDEHFRACADIHALMARADAAEAQVAALVEALRTVRALPPITDEDGDCAFCWGANHSSEEPVDEGGHHSWCPYAATLSDLTAAAAKHDADVLARALTYDLFDSIMQDAPCANCHAPLRQHDFRMTPKDQGDAALCPGWGGIGPQEMASRVAAALLGVGA